MCATRTSHGAAAATFSKLGSIDEGGAKHLVQSLDAELARHALDGRYAAWHRDMDHQNLTLKTSKTLLLNRLRQLLVLRTRPLWIEVQLIVAIWLATFACVEELMLCAGSDVSHQGMAEVWDRVHNGVHNRFWLHPQRNRQGVNGGLGPVECGQALEIYYARCARIAKRTEVELDSQKYHATS